MKRTTVVVMMFLAALLAGVFLRYSSSAAVPKKMEKEEDVEKETFFQREVGMPLDMQSVTGATGVAGYEGTPPLLGSEPKPVPERPYDMADDTQLNLFEGNKMSADCCPSPFSGDRGCICLTDKQVSLFSTRGGNR